MGKRLLSSPKKRSPKKKIATDKVTSKQVTNKSKPAGTVSVAELFTKQKDAQAKNKSFTTCPVESNNEVIDISDSPEKREPNISTLSTESPYFSPNKIAKDDTHILRKVHTVPSRRVLTKLSLKRKRESEPCGIKPESQVSKDKDVRTDEKAFQNEIQHKKGVPLDTERNAVHVEGTTRRTTSRLSLGKRKRSTMPPLQSQPLSSKAENADEQTSNLIVSEKKRKLENMKEETSESTTPVKSAADAENGEVESDNEDGEPYRVPYYVENFKLIVKSILEDSYYEELFNEQDLDTVARFNNLSDAAQKLYVRLFGRKFKWITRSKIKYPKIAEDLSEALSELVTAGLLYDEKCMDDLEGILRVLPAPELQNLAKGLKISLKNQQKQQLIEAVIKHSKQKHIGAFFKQAANTSTMVLKRAKDMLGKCYKLVKESRAVFSRLMMLFSLHHATGDEDEVAGQQQIFQMLMSNIGRIKYPAFSILRQTKIYKTREDLLRFESAIQLSSDLYDAFEAKEFDSCANMYDTAKVNSKEVWENKDVRRYDGSLPEYLRWFTAGAVYARIFTYGVEVLQRKKLYKEAVEQLEELTGQKVYHPDYRGRWYDRLALNTEQHLKQPGKALDIIKEALADDRVRAGHRLSLFQRATRICHANQHKKLHHRWKEFKDDPMAAVKDAPKVTIEGTLCPHSMPGEARMWVSKDSYTTDNDEVILIKRVEDVVLVHLRDNGYPKGIHGEGGTFSTLFCLFFWDVIFKDLIPDTFHSPYQSCPLDYSTDHFYINRKDIVDERLESIRISCEEELHEMVCKTWKENYETFCSGLNWERFLDLDHALGLVSCMGGKVLAGIFERLVKNMRHVRGGVPDLVVWNTDTKKFKVVEVKGPNDRLSTKQILWLDYLVRLGVDAETCHVVAVGAKKLKTSSSVTSMS